MKVTIEKVPEGVRVTVTPSSSKKPLTFVIAPGQLGMIETVLRTAMSSEVFKVDVQL